MRLIDADQLKAEIPSWIHCKIDEQPTVCQVKYGHWIYVELIRSYGTLNGIQCSECGKEQPKGSFGLPKYCSECGARNG